MEGDELLEAVIERFQRYAIETLGDSERENFRRYKSPHMLGTIRETFSEEFMDLKFYLGFYTASLSSVVTHDIATAEAVSTLMQEDKTLSRLAQTDVMGTPNLAIISYTVGISENGDRTVREEIRRNLARGSGTESQDIGDIHSHPQGNRLQY